jgi:hypothetical protein
MALTDIVTYGGEPAILEMSRGDIGTITDIQIEGQNNTERPLIIAGGGSNEYGYAYA